jgi:hypothetical protein
MPTPQVHLTVSHQEHAHAEQVKSYQQCSSSSSTGSSKWQGIAFLFPDAKQQPQQPKNCCLHSGTQKQTAAHNSQGVPLHSVREMKAECEW